LGELDVLAARSNSYLYEEEVAALRELREWLFTRPWPGLYPELELAFENFRRIAADLLMVIQHSLEKQDDQYRLVPLYHKQWVDNYDELLERNEWIVDLIHDLVAELTRAANWVLDAVRLYIDKLFRIDEGVLYFERQGAGLYYELFRARDSPADLIDPPPYGGFDDFLQDRSKRDIHFGTGRNDGGYRAVRGREMTIWAGPGLLLR
jgi:hypothetical protein